MLSILIGFVEVFRKQYLDPRVVTIKDEIKLHYFYAYSANYDIFKVIKSIFNIGITKLSVNHPILSVLSIESYLELVPL